MPMCLTVYMKTSSYDCETSQDYIAGC